MLGSKRGDGGGDSDLATLIGLLDGDASALPSEHDALDRLAKFATKHRVDGLIDLAAEPARSMPIEVKTQLAGQALRAEHRRGTLNDRVIALLGALEAMDVPAMILKGWWTSLTVYDEPSQRRFVDLDIWIDPACALSIAEIAARLQPSRDWQIELLDQALDAELFHNVAVAFKGLSVELHRNPYGLKVNPPGQQLLWIQHAVPAEFEGRRYFQPSLELGLAISCVNYTRDCFRHLYQLVDVKRVAEHYGLDWQAFWRLCEDQQISRFAHGALALAVRTIGLEPPPGLSPPRGWSRWWTADKRVLRLDFTLSELVPAQLLMPAGLRSVIRVARRWLAPPPELIPLFEQRYSLPEGRSYLRSVFALNRSRFEAWQKW